MKELEVRWRNHQIMVRWLKNFFQYLDRSHVEMHNISNLNDQGMKQFKQIIVDRFIGKVIDAFLVQVRKERHGDQIDVETGLLSKITEALIYLSTEKVCVEGLNPLKELEQRLLD